MKKRLIIDAKNLTQAKRKASIIMNKKLEVVQFFEWNGMYFFRVNKVSPNNTIIYTKWD